MKSGIKRKAGWLRAVFIMVLVLMLVKLGLTFSGSVLKDYVHLSTPEVIAGDRKDKSQDASTQPQKDAPASDKAASSAKDSRPAASTKTAKAAPASSSSALSESLAGLQQKEAELKKKDELLREKEERLTKMESEVEQKLKDLITLQKEIQAYRTEKAEGANTKVRSLAKIYGTMKPKEAAKLMENLDDKLVMSIISTMNSDEAASIMANMEVKKAAKISEALSGK
jgi:flagellar motility protein MotE (MotC chaperone)